MRNINSIIASHNKYRNRELCPLQNQCLTPMIIYEAIVVNNNDGEKRVYFGASDTIFKERYCNYTQNSPVLNEKLLNYRLVMQKPITVYCV